MHIPQDKRVRQYELTYVVPGSLTNDEVAQVRAAVEKLVKKHKGSIISQEDWGKKTLAYTIKTGGKRHTEGVYSFMVLEFDTSATVEFEKDIYLNQNIIRHLLIVAEAKNEKATAPAKAESEA